MDTRADSGSGSIIPMLIFIALGFGIWYFFIDTLKISNIVGNTGNPIGNMLINVLDFDTGVTRYDVHILKSKAPLWDKRMQEIAEISDPQRRKEEQDQLLAEMIQDPAIRKATQKLIGFSADAVFTMLKSINGF